jgi:hypothetical protein
VAGNGPDTGVCPIAAEIGIQPDDKVDLDGRTSESLERFGTKQIMLNPKEE